MSQVFVVGDQNFSYNVLFLYLFKEAKDTSTKTCLNVFHQTGHILIYFFMYIMALEIYEELFIGNSIGKESH